MRVALYYPWIYLTSGAERIILELSRRSRHQFALFTNRYEPERTFPELQEQQVVRLREVPVDRRLGWVAVAGWKILTQRLPLEDFDVLLVVCEGLGDLILFRNAKKPAMCVCLTPLRPVFDPVYRDQAMRRRGLLGKVALKLASACFRAIDRLAWRRYARVFCISQEVARRAAAGGLSAAGRLEVLHPGLGFESPVPGETFKHFFLIPGRIMWTKNIELGIRAFKRFQEANPEFAGFRLIIAGIVDEKSQPYYEQLKHEASRASNVQFRNFPSDAEMASLYRDCYAVLFTSFNEDWGIVPLEAMAFGKPVIAVDRGGPRETVEHGRSGFLEEPEPQAFARRMTDLVRDPGLAMRMGRAGIVRSQQFSWQSFIDRIDQEIDTLAAVRVPAQAAMDGQPGAQKLPA